MKHKVFIPVTDDLLYDHPELITAPLRPYQIDNPCFHWMATIESPEDAENDPKIHMRFDHRTPLQNLDKSSSILRDFRNRPAVTPAFQTTTPKAVNSRQLAQV